MAFSCKNSKFKLSYSLRYVVRRYATLLGVTLRCKTLRYVVGRYATL